MFMYSYNTTTQTNLIVNSLNNIKNKFFAVKKY